VQHRSSQGLGNPMSEGIPCQRESQLKKTQFCGSAVNFINALRARFLYKILAPKITKPNITREKLLNLLS